MNPSDPFGRVLPAGGGFGQQHQQQQQQQPGGGLGGAFAGFGQQQQPAAAGGGLGGGFAGFGQQPQQQQPQQIGLFGPVPQPAMQQQPQQQQQLVPQPAAFVLETTKFTELPSEWQQGAKGIDEKLKSHKGIRDQIEEKLKHNESQQQQFDDMLQQSYRKHASLSSAVERTVNNSVGFAEKVRNERKWSETALRKLQKLKRGDRPVPGLESPKPPSDYFKAKEKDFETRMALISSEIDNIDRHIHAGGSEKSAVVELEELLVVQHNALKTVTAKVAKFHQEVDALREGYRDFCKSSGSLTDPFDRQLERPPPDLQTSSHILDTTNPNIQPPGLQQQQQQQTQPFGGMLRTPTGPTTPQPQLGIFTQTSPSIGVGGVGGGFDSTPGFTGFGTLGGGGGAQGGSASFGSMLSNSSPAFGGTGNTPPAFGGVAFGGNTGAAGFGGTTSPAFGGAAFGGNTGATPAFGGIAFGGSTGGAFAGTTPPAFGAGVFGTTAGGAAFGGTTSPAFGQVGGNTTAGGNVFGGFGGNTAGGTAAHVGCTMPTPSRFGPMPTPSRFGVPPISVSQPAANGINFSFRQT